MWPFSQGVQYSIVPFELRVSFREQEYVYRVIAVDFELLFKAFPEICGFKGDAQKELEVLAVLGSDGSQEFPKPVQPFNVVDMRGAEAEEGHWRHQQD